MWEGEFTLETEIGNQYAVPGLGVSNALGMRLNFITPLFIYVPRKGSEINLNTDNAFNRDYVFLSGIYEVEKEHDSKYVYLPISFVRDLTDNENASSSIEIKVEKESETDAIKRKIARALGSDYVVQNRYEQQEIFYKVMKSERLAIFVILTFILIIASFNIIGSLTMLIIEKERDIEILKSLGADNRLIKNIFIFEGWLISIIGACAGVVLGFLVCWLQQTFGLVRLNSESLLMDAYPVVLKLKDFLIVPATVLLIGYWAAWYPVRYLTRRFLRKEI
jgi:lipoprotein-releasing system permease protein